MPVDIAGVPFDYDGLKKVLKDLGREDIMILCDSAHSFGAKYKGKPVGSQCDFHSFSFHAVKNLTTAEGGALTFKIYSNAWSIKRCIKQNESWSMGIRYNK